MENYSRTLELVETAEESAGRSAEQFAKYADSTEYKIKQLKNTWEQFKQSFLESDDFKAGLEALNTILEKLRNLDLSQIIAAITMISTLGITGVKNAMGSMQFLTTSISTAISSGVNYAYDSAVKGFSKVSGAMGEQTESVITKAFNNAYKKTNVYTNDIFKNIPTVKGRESLVKRINLYEQGKEDKQTAKVLGKELQKNISEYNEREKNIKELENQTASLKSNEEVLKKNNRAIETLNRRIEIMNASKNEARPNIPASAAQEAINKMQVPVGVLGEAESNRVLNNLRYFRDSLADTEYSSALKKEIVELQKLRDSYANGGSALPIAIKKNIQSLQETNTFGQNTAQINALQEIYDNMLKTGSGAYAASAAKTEKIIADIDKKIAEKQRLVDKDLQTHNQIREQSVKEYKERKTQEKALIAKRKMLEKENKQIEQTVNAQKGNYEELIKQKEANSKLKTEIDKQLSLARQAKVSAQENIKSANLSQKELAKWNAMTPEQRVAFLNGDYTNQRQSWLGTRIINARERVSKKYNDTIVNPQTQEETTGKEIALNRVKGSITNGVSFGISTAITSALLGAGTKQAITNGIISSLSIALPTLIGEALEFTGTLLGSAGSAALLATAIIGVLVYSADKAEKERKKQELERLNEISKKEAQIHQQRLDAINRIKNAEKEQNELEEKTKRLEELQSKSFLNSSETEELKSLGEAINNSYPDIVETFDENTKEIKINSEKLNDLNDTLNEKFKNEISYEYATFENNKAGSKELADRSIKELQSMKSAVGEDLSSPYNIGLAFENLRAMYGDNFSNIFKQDWMQNITADNAKKILGNINFTYDNVVSLINTIKENYSNAIEDISEAETTTYLQYKNNIDEITAKALTGMIEVNDNSFYDSRIIGQQVTRRENGQVDVVGAGILQDLIKNGDLSSAAQYLGIDNDILKTSLGKLGYKLKADKKNGINSYQELFLGGTKVSKYEDLTDATKNLLEMMGIDKTTYDKNPYLTISNLLANMIKGELGIAGLQQELSGNGVKYEGLSKVIKDYEDKTEEEYTKAIRDYAESNAIDSEKLLENLLNDKDSYSSQFRNMQKELNAMGIIADQLTFESLKAVIGNFKDSNYSTTLTRQWGTIFTEVTKGLSSDATSILASIDLKQNYGALLTKTSEYADELVKAGVDTADAAKIYLDYIEQATGLLGKSIYNIEGVDIFRDTLGEAYDANREKNSSLIEAMNMMNDKGYIDYKTATKLTKNGMRDYYTSSGGQLVLTNDAYEKYANEQFSIYQTYENQLKHDRDRLNNYLELQDKYAFNLTAAEEVYKKTGDINKVNEKLQMLILEASEADMSIEEYLDSFKKATAALEGVREEEQIRYINELGEAYYNTSEQLANAKEKLEDYNLQLEDYTENLKEQEEAIKKAEEKLDEAFHGSKNLQTGLDEFQNFDSKLSDISDRLKEINSELEDYNEFINIGTNLQEKFALENEQASIQIAKGLSAQVEVEKAKQELINSFGATFDENNRINLNLDYLTKDANDAERKRYEELVSYFNKNLEVAKENETNKILRELEKERRNELKKHYDTIAKLDNDNIKVLQENAKEEVKKTKDKYNALKEADNDYLEALEDAINKQKRLRDREKENEDLAKQEKKLSLMRRDTSGANQVELAKLEEEVKNKRQDNFDKQVDDVLNDLKELYKKEEELKQEEIEALEAVTDEVKFFAEQWAEIRNSFTSADDYVEWRFENDKDLQDLTPEQAQAKIFELQDEYNNFIVSQTAITNGIKTNQQEIIDKANEVSLTINNLTSNYIENLNALTAKTVTEAIESAQQALTNAQNSYKKTEEKIDDLNKKIHETETTIESLTNTTEKSYGAFIDGVKQMSNMASVEVYTTVARLIATMKGIDPTTEEGWIQLSEEMKSQNFLLNNADYQMIRDLITTGSYVRLFDPTSLNITEMSKQQIAQSKMGEDFVGPVKYAKGGLVNYTGPAWVDGSFSKPEAFLSSEDTARIGAAAKLLSNINLLNNSDIAKNSISSNVGDTSIEIHINVDKITSDYDVDSLAERIKRDIVNIAKPIGTSVILAK